MNWGKKIFIGVVFLVLLSSFVLADDLYYRKLGDGCNSGLYFGSCESGCKWELVGNSLSKTCELAYGWCTDTIANTCDTCDYVFTTNENPIYYTCETIDCETFGENPRTNAENEWENLYLYNLCEYYGVENEMNEDLAKEGPFYCKDADNDGYGTECSKNDCSTCKRGIDFKNMQEDCDDNNPDINPESIWVADRDNDGRWGDMIIQCTQRSEDWELVEQKPNPDDFDCNDFNPNNEEFPIGCYCNEKDEGKIIENAFCYNKEGNRSVEATGLETEFKVERYYSGRIWAKRSERSDFNGNLVDCPLQTCPVKSDDGNRYCALPGSYWDDEGNVELEGGNNFCQEGDENAFWGTRSSDINALFMTMGELSGEDFVVYCDDLENIVHTTSQNDATPGYDSLMALRALTSNPTSTRLGQGCVLLINTPNTNTDDYSAKILDGDVPIETSQKVIFGTIINQRDLESKYFEIDFTQRREASGWLFGRQGDKDNGLIYDQEKQILLLTQTKDGEIDPQLMSYIEQIINPNNIAVNFYSILVNPIKYLITLFNSNAYDPDQYSQITATDFDKSYLGMNSGTFFYSVLEGDDLISKVVNPGNNLKEFLRKTCNDELFQTDFRCDGADENFVGNIVGLTSNLESLNSDEKDDMWRKFSRQIRLQGNPGGSADFREGECTANDLSGCSDKKCYNPESCLSNGMCNYVPITQCVANDNCCPEGCTHEGGDYDCDPKPPLNIVIDSNLRYGLECEENETIFLRLSNEYNAHAEDPNVEVLKTEEHFNNLLCISSPVGNFTVNLRNVCNTEEETTLSLLRTMNSHVAQPESTNYPLKLCIEHSEFVTDCKIGSKDDCIGYSTIASITDLENGHIATADYYNNKLCCKLYEEGDITGGDEFDSN